MKENTLKIRWVVKNYQNINEWEINLKRNYKKLKKKMIIINYIKKCRENLVILMINMKN